MLKIVDVAFASPPMNTAKGGGTKKLDDETLICIEHLYFASGPKGFEKISGRLTFAVIRIGAARLRQNQLSP
ncbi:hypothetical protein MUK42_29752 [Musa troglodytarum]|uniref:Uncharacterized protein n=1 Tax=Musa troglodytarum TaxID=320322 RepID=A0A9E7FQS0_9LILI|nr:hypothetical protein MUK42_29752 [Musa troglodytarum]